MNVWALSDLHLGPAIGKGHFSSGFQYADAQPMMRKTMDELISPEDLILMPGDFSWNHDPADLRYDYLWIDERPGTKILSPGNHDYGIWSDGGTARAFCADYPTLNPVRDEAIRLENPYGDQRPGLVIVGVEGSQSPEDHYFNTNAGESARDKDPESVRFLEQLLVLSRSLDAAQGIRRDGDDLVVMFHYSPFAWRTDRRAYRTAWTSLIERAGATLCVYGHLHREEQFQTAFQGNSNGVEYRFVGADFLLFHPTKLGRWGERGLEIDAPEVTAEGVWRAPEKKTTVAVPKREGSEVTVHGATAIAAGATLSDMCQSCTGTIAAGERYYEHGGFVWHEECGTHG